MFKHVLVPIDGSRFSERAIDYAAQLIAGSAAELSLVIVVPNYLAASFPGSNLPGAEELQNHHKQLAQQYIAQKAQEVSTRFVVQAKGVALKGSPADEINEYATMDQGRLDCHQFARYHCFADCEGRNATGQCRSSSDVDRHVSRAASSCVRVSYALVMNLFRRIVDGSGIAWSISAEPDQAKAKLVPILLVLMTVAAGAIIILAFSDG
jgi:hypothetical protein